MFERFLVTFSVTINNPVPAVSASEGSALPPLLHRSHRHSHSQPPFAIGHNLRFYDEHHQDSWTKIETRRERGKKEKYFEEDGPGNHLKRHSCSRIMESILVETLNARFKYYGL